MKFGRELWFVLLFAMLATTAWLLFSSSVETSRAKAVHDDGQSFPEHQAHLREVEKRKAAEKIAVAKCQEQSWSVVKTKGLNVKVENDGTHYFPQQKTYDYLVGSYHFQFRDADRGNADPRYLNYASYLENMNGSVRLWFGDGAALFGLFLSLQTDIPSILKATGQAARISEIEKVRFPIETGRRPSNITDEEWRNLPQHWVPHDEVKVAIFCRPNRESKMIWEMPQDEKTTVEEYLKYLTQYPHSGSKWNWSRSRPELGLEEYLVTNPGVPMRSRSDPLGPKSDKEEQADRKYTKPWIDRYSAIYLASDQNLRKPDGGLYTFYCRHPVGIPGAVPSNFRNECYYHYYTQDGILIHVDFSPHQLKFWREITQYIPTFIESIRIEG